MRFIMSTAVRLKLRDKHNVSNKEIFECFFNRTHSFLMDTREEHLTDPITQWFISETDLGRKLKVCFVQRDDVIEIKTAYEQSTPRAIDIYYRIAKEC